MVKLESQRLVIRDHIEDDLLEIHSLLYHPVEMYFLPNLRSNSIDESRIRLDEAINEANRSSNREKYFFAMLLKDNSYVGEIGYTVIKHKHNNNKTVNLGYFIKQKYWGRGYTTEAAKKVIHFAFTDGHVKKIETGCLVNNCASEKVMIKCGFKKQRTIKKAVFMNDKWRDRVEYELTKRDYIHQKGSKEYDN